MPTRSKAAIVYKKVQELILGDKVLTGIVGYKGRTLFPAGHTLSVSDIEFVKKQLAQTKPTMADEMYVMESLAKCDIKDSSGKIVVAYGKEITEDAVAPLMGDGYRIQNLPGGKRMLTREQKWDDNIKWFIADINPQVQVETILLVDDEDDDVEDEAPASTSSPRPRARKRKRKRAASKAANTTPKTPVGTGGDA